MLPNILRQAKKKKRRLFQIIRRAKSKKAEGYIDIVILTLAAMLVLTTIITVTPIFLTKLTLDNYANELAREAEISGRIGEETTNRLERLNEIKGLNPTVTWDKNGQFQIGTDAEVTVSVTVDIGFYVFGSFPITLNSTATATSEVFWKG